MPRHQILWTVIALGTTAFLTSWRWPRTAWLVLAGITALILYATLRGGPGVAAADCFIPDDVDARVLDVLQNIVLFMPVGLAIGALHHRRAVFLALVAGTGLSALVELVQVFLPSRCSSIIDVVTNGTGAVFGAAIIVVTHTLVARLSAKP